MLEFIIKYWMEWGFGIVAGGLTNIGYLYNSYHALGGNGTGTELYNRAKALPIKNSYTEE